MTCQPQAIGVISWKGHSTLDGSEMKFPRLTMNSHIFAMVWKLLDSKLVMPL